MRSTSYNIFTFCSLICNPLMICTHTYLHPSYLPLPAPSLIPCHALCLHPITQESEWAYTVMNACKWWLPTRRDEARHRMSSARISRIISVDVVQKAFIIIFLYIDLVTVIILLLFFLFLYYYYYYYTYHHSHHLVFTNLMKENIKRRET